MKIKFYCFLFFLLFLNLKIFCQSYLVKEIIGVNKGVSLFIQNPYLESVSFCISHISLNNKEIQISNLSGIKIDFDDIHIFTPVSIKIYSKDSTCKPIILNPEAINFHTAFSFTSLNINDTLIIWEAKGERNYSSYNIEKFIDEEWVEQGTVKASGKFESSKYSFKHDLNEGYNKFRIKYDFGNGNYLYSNELNYDYYPEPVKFNPRATLDTLFFSRPSKYEIYNNERLKILTGKDIMVDVSSLEAGDYVIYFDEIQPSSFTKLAPPKR